MIDSLVYICLYLFGISIVFIPLELSFRISPAPVFRREWFVDAGFYFGQALVWNSFTVYVLGIVFAQIDFYWLKEFQTLASHQPFLLRIIEVVLLSDLFIFLVICITSPIILSPSNSTN